MEKSKCLWVKKATPKKSVRSKNLLLGNKALIQRIVYLSNQSNNYLLDNESTVIELCNNFNDCVIKFINPLAYEKYKQEMSNLAQSAYDFVTCKKKNWNNLLCSVLKSANITQ